MKTLVLLGVVITVAFSNALYTTYQDHHGNDITHTIQDEGYPVQNITVETRDGYLLDLFRIPGPQNRNPTAQQSNKQSKPAVLLMHGLLGSAHDFVAGGHARGLAYKLADSGFDVFIGNARGSLYGRKHKHLNPEKDSHFWKFCWDHIASKDLPAIIDKVLATSGQQKLHYIGHNQGSTVFYALASEKPEYNSKVEKMFALGPLVYIKHADHPLMSLIMQNENSPAWILKNLGKNEFSPSNSVKSEGKQEECNSQDSDHQICNSLYFLVNGYSKHFNKTIAHEIANSHQNGASTKQLLHYAQLIKSGRFMLYDGDDDNDSDSESSSDSSSSSDSQSDNTSNDNHSNNEEYNLKKVSVSNYLFYVPDDDWYNEEDINTLESHLPNVAQKLKFPQYSSNVDLLIAKDAHHHVHQQIVQHLQGRTSSYDKSEEYTRY